MAKQREACVIEEDIHLLLNQIREQKNLHDDQCEQLLQQHFVQGDMQVVTAQQPYSNDVNYYKEFWRYYILNEFFIKKITELSTYNGKLSNLANDLEDLQNEYSVSLSQRNKKKNRRISSEIQKSYACPYERCNKQYGSDVSLNLHIKLKHEGGNKTDREKYAAKETGQELPDVNIKFPPGYLEQFKNQSKIEKTVKPKQERMAIFYDD